MSFYIIDLSNVPGPVCRTMSDSDKNIQVSNDTCLCFSYVRQATLIFPSYVGCPRVTVFASHKTVLM